MRLWSRHQGLAEFPTWHRMVTHVFISIPGVSGHMSESDEGGDVFPSAAYRSRGVPMCLTDEEL
jgi:hypothetical protein